MFLAGFELPDPSNELLQTVALDSKATWIVNKINVCYDNESLKHYNGDILVIHKDTFQFYCTNY
jgi:superfamily I DNA and RNA helicase